MHNYYKIKDEKVVPTEEFKNLEFDEFSNATLIDLCIDKFQFMLETNQILETGGIKTCALCQVYQSNRCINCPIAKMVNEVSCGLTPYDAILQFLVNDETDLEDYQELIEDEIEFLKSVKNANL